MKLELVLAKLKSTTDPILADCVKTIENDSVLFHSGFLGEKKVILNTYEVRLKIAKEVNRDKYSDKQLLNWEHTLKKLRKCQTEEIWTNWIYTNKFYYFFFWDNGTKELIAFLWLNHKLPIEEIAKIHNMNFSRDSKVHTVRYTKGKIDQELN